jgi:hypothetical protein
MNLQVRPGMVAGDYRIGAIASLICAEGRYLLAAYYQETLKYVKNRRNPLSRPKNASLPSTRTAHSGSNIRQSKTILGRSVCRSEAETIWIVDAHRNDGRRFVVHADEKLSAFIELEREVLTVTFYLESIHTDLCK